MQFNYIQKSKMHFVGALGLIFGLASCGTYQYAGYEDDGVYGESNTVEYRAESTQDNSSASKSGSGYYNTYFKEKSQELDYISQEDAIFTDIDSYEGNYEVENDTLVDENPSYAGWGQNSTDVSINIYGGGYYGSYWWGSPYYYSPWYYGYGYGYGNYWGYGYNNYWCPPYYYGSYYSGWYSPYYYSYPYRYYGNHYYNGYYNRRGYAYNSGRRGYINRNLNTSSRLNRRSTVVNSRSNTYRPRRTANFNRNNSSTVRPRTINRRTTTRSTRPNVNNRSNTRTRIRNNSSSMRTRGSSTRTRSTSRSNYRSSPSRSSMRSSSPSRSSMRSSSPSRSSSRRSGNSGSARRGGKI